MARELPWSPSVIYPYTPSCVPNSAQQVLVHLRILWTKLMRLTLKVLAPHGSRMRKRTLREQPRLPSSGPIGSDQHDLPPCLCGAGSNGLSESHRLHGSGCGKGSYISHSLSPRPPENSSETQWESAGEGRMEISRIYKSEETGNPSILSMAVRWNDAHL